MAIFMPEMMDEAIVSLKKIYIQESDVRLYHQPNTVQASKVT